MKQTQIQLGGWEPYSDDIQYIQDGVRDAFAALVRSLSESDTNGFRLWGLDMTVNGLTLEWTEGAVAMNGEIFLVDAGTTVRPSTFTHTWKFVAVDDWGQSNYSGTGLQNTRNNRKATLAATPNTIPFNATRYDAPFLMEVIHPVFELDVTNSYTWSAEHDLTGPTTWTVTDSRYWFKRMGKTLHVNVEVISSTLASDATHLDMDLPGGSVAAGSFSGTAWVNNIACLAKTLDGGDVIRVFGNFGDGPVTLNLQMAVNVM